MTARNSASVPTISSDPRPFMDGKRDLRLDLLRGYAIFVMTLTHLGMASPLIFITGGSRFLINAAEVFFFISGFTIGIIASGRALGQQVQSRLNRAWLIYRYVLFFSFALTLLLEQFLFRELAQGEVVAWLVEIIALKEAMWDMDILIAYVIYVALSPLALWGLSHNRTRMVMLAIATVYVLTLLQPFVMSLEFASFRHLAANSPLFFGAIVLGYHRGAVAAWWRHRRWRPAADAGIVVAGAALLVAFLLDYGGNQAVAEFLGDFVIRELLMPPHNLAIVLLYLRVLWLLVTGLWTWLVRIGGWLFLPLGQESLFAYCMHSTVIWMVRYGDLPVDEESHLLLRLLMEGLVVGTMLGSILLRRWVMRFLGTRGWDAWVNRHLLNVLIWTTLALTVMLTFAVSEPGDWWWEHEDVFEDW